MEQGKTKGLTGFGLKYLALGSMVLDHIHYMFEFTGAIPIAFSWIGRLAAPLFLFCLVEGFLHTHHRLKYFLKIYLISVGMGAIRFGFYNVLSPAIRGDGFYPVNGMLSTFAILFVVMQGMDWIRQRRFAIGTAAVVLPLALPILVYRCVMIPCMNSGNELGIFIINLLGYTVLPLHNWIVDGGTVTILEGMILLLFSYCKNKRIRIYVWGTFVVLWNFLGMNLMGLPLNTQTVLFDLYDWMGVFSMIPMLCYNGERGHGNAKLFYWFYPVHIYVLYGLSVLVYMVTR